MDVIDGKWIADRLSGEFGEKARLARAMGIDPDKLSKILKGHRSVRPQEVPGLMQFLKAEAKPLLGTVNGFVEGDTHPFEVKGNGRLQQLVATLAPDAEHPEAYTMTADVMSFGLMKGDLLIIAMGESPKSGEMAIVTIADPETGSAKTEVRRFMPPWLIAGDANHAPVTLGENPNVAVLGTIRASIRGGAIKQG